MERRKITSLVVVDAGRRRRRRAAPARPLAHADVLMENYAAFLAALVALLFGLAAGKAWERYKLREGRWIDRRKARESPHFILGLNFLVANQLDRAIDELSRAAQAPAGRHRDRDDPRQPVPREGTGRPRDHDSPGPAAAPEAHAPRDTRTSCSAWASTTSAAGSSTVRSKRSRKCCASTREPVRPGQPAETPRRTAPVERGLARSASGWSPPTDAPRTAAAPADPGVPRERTGRTGAQAPRLRDGGRALRGGHRARPEDRAGVSQPRRCPAARRPRRMPPPRRGRRSPPVSPERAYLTFARLAAVARAAARTTRRFEGVCRRLIAANAQEWRARTGARGTPARAGDGRRGARSPAGGAVAQSARADDPPGDLAHAHGHGPRRRRRRSVTST